MFHTHSARQERRHPFFNRLMSGRPRVGGSVRVSVRLGGHLRRFAAIAARSKASSNHAVRRTMKGSRSTMPVADRNSHSLTGRAHRSIGIGEKYVCADTLFGGPRSSRRMRAGVIVADDPNDQTATNDAFELLHYLAAKRLERGRLTVIDATNVQPESRKSLVELARE